MTLDELKADYAKIVAERDSAVAWLSVHRWALIPIIGIALSIGFIAGRL